MGANSLHCAEASLSEVVCCLLKNPECCPEEKSADFYRTCTHSGGVVRDVGACRVLSSRIELKLTQYQFCLADQPHVFLFRESLPIAVN